MGNQYFDISSFPKNWGIVVFPISMSRIGNTQSPKKCLQALDFLTSKIQMNKVGANFIYSEGLYMNFEQDAYETKNRFARTAVSHMRGVQNLINKDFRKFQIDSAFSFESWFQMYLAHKDFFKAYKTVQELYANDSLFRQCVHEDIRNAGKEENERQVSFFLEEHTFTYLILHKEFRLRNDFVNGREQWVLYAYPGIPPKASVYLVQNDPLQLGEDSNPYKGQYDLLSKRFIDYLKTDLNTYPN